MICSRPITIKNRKKHFVEGFDKPLIKCACGKCNSCRISNQNDWYLRSLYHYKDFVHDRKGIVVFITLTFNDDNLHYYHNGEIVIGKQNLKPIKSYYHTQVVGMDKDLEMPKYDSVKVSTFHDYTFQVFSKPYLDKYIDSVRKYFKRNYDIEGIEYLFCSELGGKRNRPHYHGLWFIPAVKKVKDIEGVSHYRAVILDILRRLWAGYYKNKRDFKTPNGFVLYSPSYKGGPIVNNAKAIEYVSKYISKDFTFYDDMQVKEAMLSETIRQKLKKHLPKHYQSKGFGIKLRDFILNSVDSSVILTQGVDLPRKKDNAKITRQPVPAYIRRKLMTEPCRNIGIESEFKYKTIVDKQGSETFWHEVKPSYQIPTSFNYTYHEINFEKLVDQNVKSLERFFSLDSLQGFFKNEHHVQNFVRSFCPSTVVHSVFGLLYHLECLLSPQTLRELAIYKIVYYGQQYHVDVHKLNVNDDIFSRMMLDAKDVFLKRIRFKMHFDYSLPTLSNTNNDKILYSRICKKCADFDLILDIISKLQQGVAFGKSATYVAKYKLIKKLKNRTNEA